MYYGSTCLHVITEQSLPTFKDLFKENLNINRFICTCIYNRRTWLEVKVLGGDYLEKLPQRKGLKSLLGCTGEEQKFLRRNI